MCFTINVNIVREEMEQRFGAVFHEPRRYEPNYYHNAYTAPEIPVITCREPGKIILCRWGLVPAWTKDEESAAKISTQTINARAETLSSKPSFREPIRNKRCLVPARGFYEWQQRAETKVPYYIYLKDQRIFSFAGIYDEWINPVNGDLMQSFSIITTSANPMMEKIHNTRERMPVILPRENELLWIDTGTPPGQVLNVLQPFDEREMQAHTISRLITSRGADKNRPEIIEPWKYNDNGT